MKFEELKLLDVGHTIQLVGAIYEDAPNKRRLLCFFPEDYTPHVPFDMYMETLAMNADEWQTFIQQSDHLDVEVRSPDADGTIKKAIARKSHRQIDQNISWQVFRRDSYACRYCGKDDVPLTVDHLIPWENGGPSTEENLLSACRKCNRTRGSMSYTDWLKSDYYARVSHGITNDIQGCNRACAELLSTVSRVTHTRSR